MTEPTAPSNLPSGYRPIWRALQVAARQAGSRQALAKRLGVATHTLQRLLVDGNVPDFPRTSNRRVIRAWVRTLSRLAAHFNVPAREWIEGVGIDWEDEIAALAEEVQRKAAPRRAPDGHREPSADGAAGEARAAAATGRTAGGEAPLRIAVSSAS
ncbi:MAG: hypothetical protein GF355_17765, partial [Candidatus Eisenbacteria bacterium]|nr:hypothetical protein [Candidatus Eisenbacteria bacterium]